MKRYIYLLLVLSAFLFCDKCLGLNYSEPEIIINDTLESPLHLSDYALSADTFFISKSINLTLNCYPTVRQAMENIHIARVNFKIEN